jgi:hypothetical protein
MPSCRIQRDAMPRKIMDPQDMTTVRRQRSDHRKCNSLTLSPERRKPTDSEQRRRLQAALAFSLEAQRYDCSFIGDQSIVRAGLRGKTWWIAIKKRQRSRCTRHGKAHSIFNLQENAEVAADRQVRHTPILTAGSPGTISRLTPRGCRHGTKGLALLPAPWSRASTRTGAVTGFDAGVRAPHSRLEMRARGVKSGRQTVR